MSIADTEICSGRWAQSADLRLAAGALANTEVAQILDEAQKPPRRAPVAYARLMLGDEAAVKDLAARFSAAPDWVPGLDDSPWDARFGNSYKLYLAAAELDLGERSAAVAHLDALVAMLSRMIDGGVKRGETYELRAEARALLGHAEEAMQDLAKASELGWRRVWFAEHEPFFISLRGRSDFQLLMSQVGQSNDQLRDKIATDH